MKLKTPLRYPGGKSRAVPKLLQHLPSREITEYREPFLGGGSMAIEMTRRLPEEIPIWVNDLYEPLYNFWVQLRDNGDYLHSELMRAKNFHPDEESARKLFLDSKENLNDSKRSQEDRAVDFYIINKCSFSGLTESSSFSKQASESNFSIRGIDNLKTYSTLIKNWKITNNRYNDLLTDDESIVTYLDPPYEIKSNLYGRKGNMHKGFNHDEFASICDKSSSPILISYNSSQLIRDRFEKWTVAEFAHTYTMRSTGCYNKEQASRKELVLMNYEV